MKNQYDVYMCRCDCAGQVDLLENLLMFEKYKEAQYALEKASLMSVDWRNRFMNNVNSRPKNSPLKIRLVHQSITKYLNLANDYIDNKKGA
jgi:hypothetical protein